MVDDRDTPLGSSDKSFLHSFEVPYLPTKIYANNIQWTGGTDWNIWLSGSREKQSIAELMKTSSFIDYLKKIDKNGNKYSTWCTEEKIIESFWTAKWKFYKAGLATYSDMELLAGIVLAKHTSLAKKISQRFPLLIIDECQDLSGTQLTILEIIKNAGSVLHFVGDINQAIYEFNDVDPAAVKKFGIDHNFTHQKLTKNYRSTQQIVTLNNALVADNKPPSASLRQMVKAPCICLSYPKEKIHELPGWFEKYISEIIIAEKAPIDLDRCKIIARGWSTVSKLRATGRQSGLSRQQWPVAVIQIWKLGNPESVPEAINLMGRFISKQCLPNLSSSSVNNYCPENISTPYTWRIFISKALSTCASHSELGRHDIKWKDWAKYIRSHFHSILLDHIAVCPELNESNFVDSSRFRAPNGDGDKQITTGLAINGQKKSKTSITTIHDVKGQTFDAAMLVSSPTRRGKDGHWEHWLQEKDNEAARLAYVASSRPRHLLIWAVPDMDKTHEQQLSDLGFVIEKLTAKETAIAD